MPTTRNIVLTVRYAEIEHTDGSFETTNASYSLERGGIVDLHGETDTAQSDETPLGLACDVINAVRTDFIGALESVVDEQEKAGNVRNTDTECDEDSR